MADENIGSVKISEEVIAGIASTPLARSRALPVFPQKALRQRKNLLPNINR